METQYSEYQFFLFTQLFNHYIKTECEYDTLYDIVSMELEEYFISDFNDSNEPEYECMEGYLKANVETISSLIKSLES